MTTHPADMEATRAMMNEEFDRREKYWQESRQARHAAIAREFEHVDQCIHQARTESKQHADRLDRRIGRLEKWLAGAVFLILLELLAFILSFAQRVDLA